MLTHTIASQNWKTAECTVRAEQRYICELACCLVFLWLIRSGLIAFWLKEKSM